MSRAVSRTGVALWLHRTGLPLWSALIYPWWTSPAAGITIRPIMASERIQRRIETLLEEADQAISRSDWESVRDRAQNVLAMGPGGVGIILAGAPCLAHPFTPAPVFPR